jgi:hypothetical protein
MALSKAEKTAFNDEVKPLKHEVEDIKKAVNEISIKKRKHKKLEGYYNIEGTLLLIKSLNINCRMSNISLKMLGIRNNKLLDNGKSDLSKILQFLGETVGTDVDRSLRENDEYLEKIALLTPEHNLNLLRDLLTSYQNLKTSYGDDSKWKWLFVELYAKIAVIVKNMTNFSDIAKLRDPRTDYYRERKEMMDLCKDCLSEAARQYRTKYELSGKAREDLQRTIDLLSAQRKIHVLFGEDAEANKLKTTIDANRQALESGDTNKKKKK